MPKPRGADRATTTLTIGEDDHLVVLNELMAGEENDAMQGAIARVRDERGIETIQLDSTSLLFAKAAHYIRSWSFIDQSGAPIVWPMGIQERVEILRTQLSGEDWDEVRAAINAHVDTQAAKKKTIRTGPSAPVTI